MFLKGYRFYLLDNAFNIHWGFQSSATHPLWRRNQIGTNIAKFHQFANELFFRYGNNDPCRIVSRLNSGVEQKFIRRNTTCTQFW